MDIPFTQVCKTGEEHQNISAVLNSGSLQVDGPYARRCEDLLRSYLGGADVLLTGSGTAALELSALISGLRHGDEVILPSFTLTSAANAVCRTGAFPRFVDVRPDTMNMDERLIADAITVRTKAIWPMHYAGIACAPDEINALAKRFGLTVIEDAAQAVGAFYRQKPLGTFGDLAAFSFNWQKNVTCGEGGALIVNNRDYLEQAYVCRDKGTNRRAFFNGSANFYSWTGLGSSLGMPELSAAFLLAQLASVADITAERRAIARYYREKLVLLEQQGFLRLPRIPEHAEPNGHIVFFYCHERTDRDRLIAHLKSLGIGAAFHYVPLHSSPFGHSLGYKPNDLPVTEDLAGRLIRMPIFRGMNAGTVDRVMDGVASFFCS